MKIAVTLLATLLLFSGCAAIKQAHQDFQAGAITPIEAGEVTPAQQAAEVAAIVSAVPVASPFAPLVATLAGLVFTWYRGRRVRKELPSSTNPITGFLGSKVGLEGLVQNVSNVLTGLFEVGADNSGLKRGWKVGISTLLALLGGGLLVPEVNQFLTQNPQGVAIVAGLSGLIAGIEKELSKVLPVKETPA